MGFHDPAVAYAESCLAKKLVWITSPILFALTYPPPSPHYHIQPSIVSTSLLPLVLTSQIVNIATVLPPPGSTYSLFATGLMVENAWKAMDKEVSLSLNFSLAPILDVKLTGLGGLGVEDVVHQLI